MRAERLVRYTAVSLIVSLTVGYFLLSFPRSREDTTRLLDFSEFYAAADIVRHGMGNRLYDLSIQSEFQLRVAPVHAFYLRPPFEALLFVPLTYLRYRAAFTVWILMNLGILAVAVRIIQKNTHVLDALFQYTRGIPVDFGLLLILFLTFAPTMNCFLIGQDAVLVLMVYTFVYYALKRGREIEAGSLLACGLFKFHLVLPFAIIFALRRRGRFLLGFAAVAALLLIVSVVVTSPDVLAYAKMFFNRSNRALMGFQPEYAANIRGVFYLIGRGKIPAIVSEAIVWVVSATLWWLCAKNWCDDAFDLSFSAAVIAAFLTGHHAFVYDVCILLLPIAIVCSELAKRKTLMSNSTFNICLLILFVPPAHHILIVYHVYALMFLPLAVILAVVMRTAHAGIGKP